MENMLFIFLTWAEISSALFLSFSSVRFRTKHLLVKGFQICWRRPIQGEILTKRVKIMAISKKNSCLQKLMVILKETWYKASSDENNLCFSKKGQSPLPKRDNNESAKIHWFPFKIFFDRITGPISTLFKNKRIKIYTP